MDLEAPEIHKSACEFGDSYLFVWPDDAQPTGVSMYLNDPSTVRIFYSAENPRLKTLAIKSWKQGTQTRADLFYPDRIEHYITDGLKKGLLDSDWLTFDPDGNGAVVDNPFGEVPIFHFRTARPYGTPLHSGAYGPQEAINKTIINWLATTDAYAAPFRYALMNEDLADGSDPSDFGIYTEDSGANNQTYPGAGTNVSSQISGEPGTFNQLHGTSAVGQLAPSDVTNFQSTVDSFLRYMAQSTNTPIHLFDMIGDTPSGESLRVSEAPLVKSVIATQISFGATWRDAFEFTLRVIGYEAGVKVSVAWANPSSTDDLDQWQTIQAKINAGLPVYVAFLEAGYTPEQLASWNVDLLTGTDQEPKTLVEKSALYESFGKAIQAIGEGITAGAITQEQAAPIILQFISEIQGATPDLAELDAEESASTEDDPEDNQDL